MPVTLLAAKSVGTRLEMFGPAHSLADIPAAIRRMARLLGVPERGEVLVKAFDERLARLSLPFSPDAPEAVIYAANGFVTGTNSLPDDVLHHAGFRNFSTGTGRKRTHAMSLEKLIIRQPGWRKHLPIDLPERYLQFVERVLPGLVDTGMLRTRTDKQTAEQVGQRRVIVPEPSQRLEQIDRRGMVRMETVQRRVYWRFLPLVLCNR